MTQLQQLLLPLLAEHCPTRGCIRCLSTVETQYGTDPGELCEQARFLQQYMACATATIYRLNSATQTQYCANAQLEFNTLNEQLKTIKLQLIELQPVAEEYNGSLNNHVLAMLHLLEHITTEEDDGSFAWFEGFFK
jgi:hypothetical protein